MRPRTLPLVALAATLALLTACSGTAAPEESTAAGDDTTTVADEPGDPETEATTPEPEEPEVGVPSACEGLLLESDASLAGADLAACVVGAMVAAGTGNHLVDSGQGVSDVDFSWDPELSMAGDLAGASIVIRGDTGWVDTGNGWIRGDSGSSNAEEALAGAMLDAVRAFSDPRVLEALIATSATWTVVEEMSVPGTGAFVDVAWRVVADEPLTAMGVSTSDYEVYLEAGTYLTAFTTGIASYGGITTTTTSTCTQWGGEVDIPDPSEG